MKSKTVLYLFILALMLASLSLASARASEQKRDWFWVASSLQSHGISTNNVPWYIINQACMGFPLDSNEYATCQYEKVMNKELHAADRAQCEANASVAYPDTIIQPGYGYHSHRFDRNNFVIINSDRSWGREGYIGSCMTNLGWRSATNYLMGKRELLVMQPAQQASVR